MTEGLANSCSCMKHPTIIIIIIIILILITILIIILILILIIIIIILILILVTMMTITSIEGLASFPFVISSSFGVCHLRLCHASQGWKESFCRNGDRVAGVVLDAKRAVKATQYQSINRLRFSLEPSWPSSTLGPGSTSTTRCSRRHHEKNGGFANDCLQIPTKPIDSTVIINRIVGCHSMFFGPSKKTSPLLAAVIQ